MATYKGSDFPGLDPNIDTIIITDIEDDNGIGNGLGTKVVLFNDNVHTFEQVISQLMKAIKCSEETAFYHANTIHTKGQSDVYKGKIERCLTVSSILNEINLKTTIVG